MRLKVIAPNNPFSNLYFELPEFSNLSHGNLFMTYDFPASESHNAVYVTARKQKLKAYRVHHPWYRRWFGLKPVLIREYY